MESSSNSLKDKIKHIYETKYKLLLIIPFAMLAIAFLYLGFKYSATGTFIDRDVSLKGGVTITAYDAVQKTAEELEQAIAQQFPDNGIAVKTINQLGSQIGYVISSDIEEDEVQDLLGALEENLGHKLTADQYTVEVVGSTLGSSFFRELIIALIIAFAFMALVVFFFFRTFVPSLAIILAAFSDMVVTLAVISFMDVKLSSAGIAAFLMLIGYSVDTDILLSTRVLKRKDGTEMDRIYGSIKTGVNMTMTALIAVLAALLIVHSGVIGQIMLILFIGLLADLVNTWIQNVGILRLYLERKAKQNEQ